MLSFVFDSFSFTIKLTIVNTGKIYINKSSKGKVPESILENSSSWVAAEGSGTAIKLMVASGLFVTYLRTTFAIRF
jgi:hypothetical protein